MFISFSYPSLSRMKFHLFLIIVLVRTYQATHSLWPLNLLLPTYALQAPLYFDLKTWHWFGS
ncbi:uncharacterized protein BDW70DRAFT_101545 [Aspergillus foveolatus]|uniref:uncharacterized protein n=1 Tax=Aspergillus foveolatus TaxID=210207 RepID=UPI003CCE52BF